jgi:hypothetical protein
MVYALFTMHRMVVVVCIYKLLLHTIFLLQLQILR